MVKRDSIRAKTLGLLVTAIFAGGCAKVDLSGLALIDSSGMLDLHLSDNITYTNTVDDEKVEYRQIGIRLDPGALGAEDWQLSTIGIDPVKPFALSRDYKQTDTGFHTYLDPIPPNIGIVMPLIPNYVKEDITNFFTEYKIILHGKRSSNLSDGFPSKCDDEETIRLMKFCEDEGLFCYMAQGGGAEFLLLPIKRGKNKFGAGELMRMFCDDNFYFNSVLLEEKKPLKINGKLESIEGSTLERREISGERLLEIMEEHNGNIIFNGP